jgi:putative peptidoglycan lipid II flippase
MSSLLRTVLLTAPLQLVFRVGEALLPFLLAAWFGRSDATDLNLLIAKGFIFAGALLTAVFQDSVFIPTLTERRNGGNAGIFAGEILRRALGLASVAAGVFAIAYSAFLRHEPHALPLIALYAVHMLLTTVRAFTVGYLHAHRDFASYPIASGAGMSLCLTLVYLTKGALHVASIPLGLLSGEALSVVLLWTRTKKHGVIAMGDGEEDAIRRFARLASMEALGNVVTRINPLVDQLVARKVAIAGGGTLLGYAFDVASIPTTIAQAAFFSIFLTHLSEASADPPRFRSTLRRALFWVPLAIAGLSLLVFLARAPLLRLLFLRQAMDASGVQIISDVLPYALLGAAPFGALLLLARAHVALQNTRIMLGMGILNATLNAAFNVAFYPFLGLGGIALSTSVMHAAVALVFLLKLRQKPEFSPLG